MYGAPGGGDPRDPRVYGAPGGADPQAIEAARQARIRAQQGAVGGAAPTAAGMETAGRVVGGLLGGGRAPGAPGSYPGGLPMARTLDPWQRRGLRQAASPEGAAAGGIEGYLGEHPGVARHMQLVGAGQARNPAMQRFGNEMLAAREQQAPPAEGVGPELPEEARPMPRPALRPRGRGWGAGGRWGGGGARAVMQEAGGALQGGANAPPPREPQRPQPAPRAARRAARQLARPSPRGGGSRL
jgi:hypothetical protein